ncbi:MAG: ribosome silencing factor [Pseudomonadota bacterium]
MPRPKKKTASRWPAAKTVRKLVEDSLDGDKAEDVVTIDLKDKTTIADFMVVATGRSPRQLAAMAQHVVEKLKAKGFHHVPVEGREQGDWVLIDAGDVVVHLFRPEVRSHYNLEKMWALQLPEPATAAAGG